MPVEPLLEASSSSSSSSPSSAGSSSTCGHLFCQSCFARLSSNAPRCPSCKRPVRIAPNGRLQYVESGLIRRFILNLPLQCPCRPQGCMWTGSLLKYLQQHKNHCDYLEVACDLGCGAVMRGGLLQKHKQEQCPNRSVQCQYCTVCLLAFLSACLSSCQSISSHVSSV